jgi:hypothetical protein
MTLRIFLIYTMLAGALAKGLEKGCAKGCARGGGRVGGRVVDDFGGVGYNGMSGVSGPVTRGVSRIIINEKGKVESVDSGVNNNQVLSFDQMDSLFTNNMHTIKFTKGFKENDSLSLEYLYHSSIKVLNSMISMDTTYLTRKWINQKNSNDGFYRFVTMLKVNKYYDEELKALKAKKSKIENANRENMNSSEIDIIFSDYIKRTYFPFHDRLLKDINR